MKLRTATRSPGLARQWIGVVAALLAVLGTLAAAEGRLEPGGEERWEESRAEIARLTFPEAFRDSLMSALVGPPKAGLRRVAPAAFRRGERLVYSVGWGPVHAGYGVLTVTPDTVRGTLLIAVEGITNAFFSAVYRVRDLLYGVVDAEGLYPYFFEEHLREGKYRDDRWLVFDHVNGRVYTHRRGYECVDAPPFTQSVASLLYYLRALEIPTRDSFTVDCFVQKKNYGVVFLWRKKEKVRCELGEYECTVVEPVLVGRGRVFTNRDKIRIWLTDDERRLPLLIRSRIAVGSISVNLIGYEVR